MNTLNEPMVDLIHTYKVLYCDVTSGLDEGVDELQVSVGGRQVGGGGAARGLSPPASLLPLLLLSEVRQIAA